MSSFVNRNEVLIIPFDSHVVNMQKWLKSQKYAFFREKEKTQTCLFLWLFSAVTIINILLNWLYMAIYV